nr:MAG TPA: Cytochrome c oxidase subunit 1 [Bacteriophage sp.]
MSYRKIKVDLVELQRRYGVTDGKPVFDVW